ncbi:hypothetical protein ACOWM8_01425 [Helicobacter pylori]
MTLFKSLVNLFCIALVLKEFKELNAFSFVIACGVDGNASFSLFRSL